MEPSELPLEKTNRRQPELRTRAEQRPVLYRYVESPEAEVSAPGHDSLMDYRNILLRHKKTLLSFVMVGLLGGLLISLLQTPIYRVRTSLEIQGSNFLDMKGSNESTGSYGTIESYVETQVKLLQSEFVLEHVIDKLKLQKERPATGWRAFASRMKRIFEFSESSHLPERENLIREIERSLTVRMSGNSRLLEVLYESRDPKGAADFANTLVSEFIELTQEERWKSAQATAEWLTNHLDKMKAQMEASEAQLQDYARTSGLTFTSEKENLAENLLKQLQDELSKAQADRIANQAKFEAAKSKPADSLPEMLEDPTMRDYRQKLTELQRQHAELSATLTPEHYKVQRVQAQINELRSEMQKERSNVLRRVNNEYAAALRRERLLSQAHAEQERVVADQSEKAIHYGTLRRDVDSNRRLYEAMLQRVKETSLAAAMRDSNVLVIDRARPPLLPYRPNLPTNLSIGLFSGILLGFGFVLLRERLDPRISAPGDAQVYLDLPELGAIPLAELPAPQPITKGFYARPRLSPALPGEQLCSPDDCPELATWQRKPSLLAECVRTTLTSILLPTQDGSHPRVVVLTSPCPGDGKTTVASNLSIAMAEICQKVVLIDGDLRRPRLHKVFGISNDWGLSDVLRGSTALEAIPIANLVCKTKVSGLYVLAGGRGAITTSTLLYSPRMTGLLDRLRGEFDMVLVDAPPVIHLADARVLGRLADGVILVIRAGQTTPESAMIACQRFAEDGTRVLGTILNNWNPSASSNYRYAYGSQ